TPAGRLKIIDENCFVQAQLIRKALRFDNPGQVRRFHAAVVYRAGDAEAGLGGINVCSFYEFTYDLIQAGVMTAGENFDVCKLEFTVLDFKEGEACVRPSDVSGKDHFSKFLQ